MQDIGSIWILIAIAVLAFILVRQRDGGLGCGDC